MTALTGYRSAVLARFTSPSAVERDESTPAAMARSLDPKFRRTPALDLVDEALEWALTTPDARLIVNLPPQEGKSTLITKWGPVWLLKRRPGMRLVVVSYAANVARRMGRLIREVIGAFGPRLGLRLDPSVKAQHEFQIAGHEGGVYAVGVDGQLTSRPADGFIIDDPLKGRKQADSAKLREMVWEVWTDTIVPRLAPGSFVIVVQTRWHEDDLTGRLLKGEDAHRWRVLSIPAQADHDPEAGETDPLGRQPGEYMISARGRSAEQWEQQKRSVGSRTWTALYQGRPTPPEGTLFPAKTWHYYARGLWLEREDGSRWVPGVPVGGDEFSEIIQSWDCAFKDLESSDYVVGQVWLRRGIECFLLDQVRGHLGFTETLLAFERLTARWPQALLKVVEDKANGTAVINMLRRKIPGIVPEDPIDSKAARAVAVTPLTEAGNVYLPDAADAPWVADFIEEAKAFGPGASHDDQVDAMSQALNRLVIAPLQAGVDLGDVTSDDLLEDDEGTNYLAGAY